MNKIKKTLICWFRRVWGRTYPVRDIKETQKQYGRRGSHIEAKWTTPEHFAHNSYDRSHLPQICIKASGWKARIIAFVLFPSEPYDPS